MVCSSQEEPDPLGEMGGIAGFRLVAKRRSRNRRCPICSQRNSAVMSDIEVAAVHEVVDGVDGAYWRA